MLSRRLTPVALLVGISLSGCAGYQNMKGKTEIALNMPDDGVESLGNAANRDPRNAGYQLDHLTEREKFSGEFLAQADDFRAQGKLPESRTLYERVLKIDPGNARAAQSLAALQQDARYEKLLAEGEKLLEQGKAEMALDRAGQVLESNHRNQRAVKLKEAALDAKSEQQITRDKARAARSVMSSPVTLQFRDATLRVAFESLSKSTGLNILLDREVKQDSKVTIFVRDVTVADAVDLILLQNQLDKRIINANTLLIYPANPSKQAEYEDLVIRSFRVTNADIKYLANMLKSMLKLKDVAADERSNILVVRDTPERLSLAEKLIAVHDVPDPEIMLEVQVLEVSTSRASNLGVQPPTSVSISTPGAASGSLTYGELRDLTRNDLLVSPLKATINFKLEDGDAKILARPRIRARNKEKAKILIGDRVPTITNTVTPVATGSSVVTGNVTYQEVGLKLEFEPQVYDNSEVGIKLNLEVSNIVQAFTDAQGSRSYQIGTRNALTNLRLKDGETQILGGLISDQERNTASLIPGLGHLPIIGRLFGNNDSSDSRSEIVLAITPHIVRNVAESSPDTRSIFSGTANVIRGRPILSEPVTELKVSGTFGGGPGGAATPNYSAGMPLGNPVPQQPTQPVGILVNAMPAQAGPSENASAPTSGSMPAPIGSPDAGALLPAPPPMIVRPPPVRK